MLQHLYYIKHINLKYYSYNPDTIVFPYSDFLKLKKRSLYRKYPLYETYNIERYTVHFINIIHFFLTAPI